ncbi:hypothetical protein [Ferruginibacter sp.]|nr:hypothetical protein [Ferruginibacter sp.]
MKHFKFLLINIVAFSFLFFLMSLLFPGQVVTSKTVSITVSKEKVTEKLNNISNWKAWNGFVAGNAVKSNTGNNSDTLIFTFENNHQDVLQSQFNIYQEQTNAVLLNWALIEKLPWYKPWKKFSAMVLSKQVAVVMDSSLNNLKMQIESGK